MNWNGPVGKRCRRVHEALREPDQADERQPQALKSLHPVFKKAKAFESGRLIKKIRSLKYVYAHRYTSRMGGAIADAQ